MTTIELSVSGMSCSHCAASVTEELSEIPQVTSVDVTLSKEGNSRVLIHANANVSDQPLTQAVTEAGYTIVGITR